MKNQNFRLIATAILLLIIFASCSQYDKTADAGSTTTEAAPAADAAATDSVTSRQIIKTAEINMEVENVEDEVHQLQNKINNFQGHIFHYEIKNEPVSKNEVQHTLDSTCVIQEIIPTGFVKVKIPVRQADTFIQYVLKMNGRIENFYLDEEDITETILEKKELMLVDANTTLPNKNLKTTAYQTDRKELAIARKADYLKTAYKTNYLWFDIRLNGATYVQKTMIASAEASRTPFYVSAVHALSNGWYAFSVFLVAMLHIWPFLLIVIIILLIAKRKWYGKLPVRN